MVSKPAFQLTGKPANGVSGAASGGFFGGTWRYLVVAALPLCISQLQQAVFNAEMQERRDQIMQPQMMMPQTMIPQSMIPQSFNMPAQGQPENNPAGDDEMEEPLSEAGSIPYGLAPVDLPIENISQETPVWCWAAVSQQIIAASRGKAETPPQCALVATANNAASDICCVERDPRCATTGSLQQVQALVQQYGGRTSAYAEPTDAMTLYRTLKLGHAIVIGIDAGHGMGHVVVARGMSFAQTPQGVVPLVHINDPMAQFTQPVPFNQIAGVWRQAIIIN